MCKLLLAVILAISLFAVVRLVVFAMILRGTELSKDAKQEIKRAKGPPISYSLSDISPGCSHYLAMLKVSIYYWL